jgi:hypothetical protein
VLNSWDLALHPETEAARILVDMVGRGDHHDEAQISPRLLSARPKMNQVSR